MADETNKLDWSNWGSMSSKQWHDKLDTAGCPTSPPTDGPEFEAMARVDIDAQRLARGLWIVDHKLVDECISQLDQMQSIIPAWDHNSERLATTGRCCDGGCSLDLMHATRGGTVVCYQTWKVCPRRSVALIVDRFSILGG